MIATSLTLNQYEEIKELVEACKEAAKEGLPGMLLAQIWIGNKPGHMKVNFIPHQVGLEIQTVLAKYSKNAVPPGRTLYG